MMKLKILAMLLQCYAEIGFYRLVCFTLRPLYKLAQRREWR